MAEQLSQTSWIRRMFEDAAQVSLERGAGAVCDFTLGNPVLPPPAEFSTAIAEAALDRRPGMHRYMSNAGYADVREAVAAHVTREQGLALMAGHIVMCCGAAGGLNVVLKALLNPGDEVLAFAPYFPEYVFYVDNHGGVLRIVESADDFQPHAERLEAALTPRTRAIIVNSPNNPTGVVYSEQAIRALAEVLRRGEERVGHPIYLLADDIYRRLVYDGARCPSFLAAYRNTVVVNSFSKDLSIPGERIGYIAVSPAAADAANLVEACTVATRTLGFVNAPALLQRTIARCLDARIDLAPYVQNRDILCRALRQGGFRLATPGGAFYLFPQCPIADDIACCESLRNQGVFVVPGTGFGRPGHIRLAYCVAQETCLRAAPILAGER
jgi:aspartate aminotransferase